jgi:putative SOS response-associated peptidase YedK
VAGAVIASWRETEAGRAYAFLTCEPTPLVAPIYPKAMSVILHSEIHAAG